MAPSPVQSVCIPASAAAHRYCDSMIGNGTAAPRLGRNHFGGRDCPKIGTSLTRGAAILTLGIGVRPASVNSESPIGNAFAESTISRHTASVTTLKQNLSVCLSVPSGLRAMVNEIIGGTTQTTVKNQNGARLLTPLSLTVDAHPIGRGTTAPVRSR